MATQREPEAEMPLDGAQLLAKLHGKYQPPLQGYQVLEQAYKPPEVDDIGRGRMETRGRGFEQSAGENVVQISSESERINCRSCGNTFTQPILIPRTSCAMCILGICCSPLFFCCCQEDVPSCPICHHPLDDELWWC